MPAPFVDAAHIRRRTAGGAYERGMSYYRNGAVRAVHWDAGTSRLTASVRGNGTQQYTCTIRLDTARGAEPIVAAVCTCPVGGDCKHVVATLLAANAGSSFDAVSADPVVAPGRIGGSPTASWRDLLPQDAQTDDVVPLALGVELRRRGPRGRSPWSARRTEVVAAPLPAHTSAELHVALRPLVESSASGNWIRGDVSWEVLRRPGGSFDTEQARWFAELHSISRDLRTLGAPIETSEWITLDSVESALVWHHLAAAEARGIPIVGTRRDLSVTLATVGQVVAVAEPTPEGGVRLSPHITIDGQEVDASHVHRVAGSGLYLVEGADDRIDLTLAPAALSEPLRALLDAPVEVPAAETEEFLRQLPRLVRRAAVRGEGGFVVPAPASPTLAVDAAFGPADIVRLQLHWNYPGFGRIPLGGPAAGASPVSDDDRDRVVESEIHGRAVAAWAAACDLPFGTAEPFHGVDAAEIASRALPALEEVDGVTVTSTGERRTYRELTGIPEITVSSVETTDPDWFDLGILVTIEGRRIPFTPLFTALALRKKKMLLSDGGYFSLAHPALDRLRDLIEEAAELAEWEPEELRISRYQTDLWSEFEDLADEALPATSWRAAAEGLRDVERVEQTPLPAGLRAELRPYQRVGFDWLAFLWRHRLGGILADDMGLGKTLQLLAFLCHARESGERRPFLVVAPTSVLSVWRSEGAQFSPNLRIALVDTTHSKRGAALEVEDVDVIVTSYTLLRLDQAEYAAVDWAGVILDEAQFVKNPATKLHRAVRDLRADVTIAVTGTPLENSLTDLWALLSLTAPGLFASAQRFRHDYVGPIEKGKVPENQEGGEFRTARLRRLRRRIRPLLLRRTKELVAADLPPKQEQVQRIELSPAHRALYDAVLQRERQKVLGLLHDLDRNRFIVFRSLTLLRLMSLAPALVDGEHARIPSSKIDALIDQLVEVASEGHRALVFSQFTSFLGLVAARLDAAGIRHEYLDGSTRRRADVIERFRSGDAPVFLISLKAGGFGLTLTEADYVFLLDPWWNPAAEAQAVDRTHRIGQTRPVNVYRMIAADTIEEKVMALQERKARLFDAVVDDDALFSQALDADDIRGLFES